MRFVNGSLEHNTANHNEAHGRRQPGTFIRQTAPRASKNIMKTTTLSDSTRLYRTQISLATMLLAALCAGARTPAAAAKANTNNVSPPCQTTARLVRQSAINQAQADYLLELARASTLSSDADRKAATQQAQAARKESLDSAKEQYNARLTLCGLLGETRYEPVINPADFLTPAEIAAHLNTYFPL